MNKIGTICISLFLLLSLTSTLSAQLTRQWVARYNAGLKNSSNAATAMAIDKEGNVIVTGWVSRKGTGIDFATLKYSSDGQLLHSVYYGASGNGDDKAVAVAVDTGMNVYVTGYSKIGSGFDYYTIKYDSNLLEKWHQVYNGPGNGDDKPVSIAVNDSLNVFVTGYSYGGPSTGTDYATIKYNSAGVQQWASRYDAEVTGTDSAFAMALQGNTALYVTGTSRDSVTGGGGLSLDYATIKYDAVTGDTIWTTRYIGDGDDIARAIVLHSTGDVFVTGSSHTDTSGWDYLTVKYNQSDGGQVWASRYDDPSKSDDNAYAISIQGSSRVYVTGRALSLGSFNDIVTVRYNQGDGSESWVSNYNGTANDDDGGVAVTGGNNPYVAGPSIGSGVGYDYALVQYNGANGNENLSLRYNGTGNSDDIPVAVLSSNGAVYVTGSSRSGTKGADFLTIKYVDHSDLKYRSFVQNDFVLSAVSVKVGDPTSGNVRDEAFLKAFPKIKKGFPGFPGGLVAGQSRPDSAGSYAWIRFDKGKPLIKFLPQLGAAGGFELYDSKPHLGEKKNPKYPKLDNHLVGELVTLKVNIGASDAEITPPTFGDLTYDDGDTSNPYNGFSLRQMTAVVDNYLTYWKKYPPTNWPLLDTIVSRCNRSFLGPAVPLPWVSKSPLVVTGVNPVDSVAYLQEGIAPLVDPIMFPPGAVDNETPRVFALQQNYPNPFNPTTSIQFDVPEPTTVTMKVYDIVGREVATLLENEQVDEGNHELEFDANAMASGVYFYRIVADEGRFHQVRKMLLLR